MPTGHPERERREPLIEGLDQKKVGFLRFSSKSFVFSFSLSLSLCNMEAPCTVSVHGGLPKGSWELVSLEKSTVIQGLSLSLSLSLSPLFSAIASKGS